MLVIELNVENHTNKTKHNRPQKAWAGLAKKPYKDIYGHSNAVKVFWAKNTKRLFFKTKTGIKLVIRATYLTPSF